MVCAFIALHFRFVARWEEEDGLKHIHSSKAYEGRSQLCKHTLFSAKSCKCNGINYFHSSEFIVFVRVLDFELNFKSYVNSTR